MPEQTENSHPASIHVWIRRYKRRNSGLPLFHDLRPGALDDR